MKIRTIQLICYMSLLFMDSMMITVMELHFAQFKTRGALKADFNRITRSFSKTQLAVTKAALFLVFTLGRLISGYVSLLVNNKYFLLAAVTIEAAISVFLNTFTVYTGFAGFFISLSIIVLCQAMHNAPITNMTAKWIPPHEYSRAIVLINVGNSWPSTLLSPDLWSEPFITIDNVFNVIAIVKISWVLIYLLVGSQDPRLSWLVRNREMAQLSREIGPRKKIDCKARVPWRNIFGMPILYALITSNVAYRFFNNTSTQFHHLFPKVSHTGCTIAMVFQPFVLYACAWLTDVLIYKYAYSRNNVRKVWNAIALWGAAAGLSWICFFYKEPQLIAVFLTFSRYLGETANLGYSSAAIEISPNYACIIGSIISFPGWMSMLVKTYLDALTVNSQKKVSKSSLVSPNEGILPIIYRTVAVLFFLNYFFLMCGKIEVRDFDSYDTVDWRKASDVSYL